MTREEMIAETENFVREKLKNAESGHDWWHTERVRKTALYLAEQEKADLFIVQMAALLHDIDDWKFKDSPQDEQSGLVRKWLNSLSLEQNIIDLVCDTIAKISFKGSETVTEALILEGEIVQDADRLDALGALGIARAFAYGGYAHRRIHDPESEPGQHKSFEEYKKSQGTTVNHFYEKLLLLKDRMNTEAGRRIAESRHAFLIDFLAQFYREWKGQDLTPDVREEP